MNLRDISPIVCDIGRSFGKWEGITQRLWTWSLQIERYKHLIELEVVQ